MRSSVRDFYFLLQLVFWWNTITVNGCGSLGQQRPFFSSSSSSRSNDDFTSTSQILRGVLGGDIRIDQVLGSDSAGSIGHAGDLACASFDNSCRWRNVRGDRLDWSRGRGTPDTLRLQAATGTSTTPNEPFAIVASDRALGPTEGGLLVSDPIPCQEGDGEVHLKYWTSPMVELSICTRKVGSTTFDYCSPGVTNGDPGPAFINIPGPLAEPFELVVQARNFIFSNGPVQGGFAMIDDLEYVGELCRGVAADSIKSTARAPPPSTPAPLGAEAAACQLLKCDFSTGQCLDYIAGSGWRVKEGPIGNPLTGIRGDASDQPYNPRGTYAYVGGPAQGVRLETPAFSLPKTLNIMFSYYKASADTQFEVFAKKFGEPEISIFRAPLINRDSRKWYRELRQLLAGEYEKLIFQGDHLRANNFLGLDEIGLTDTTGNPLC